MDALTKLTTGLKGTVEITVGNEHTAPHVGSGKVPVLATPVLVNLLEAAALDAVEQFLPPGYQSLGTVLDVRHHAATPVGMRVRAVAELVGVEGRTLRFRIWATDDSERIGEGNHERVVVNVARFDRRMEEKAASITSRASPGPR
jgi:predicted thioesterase